MKDVGIVRYIENQSSTYQTGSRIYDCEMRICDELTYGPRGFSLLVQLVIVEILKTPGRDVIHPKDGGGLLGLIGLSPFDYDKGTPNVRVKMMIDDVEKQIIARQMGKGYPKSEMLKSLDVTSDIFFDAKYGRWLIPLEIESMAGDKQLWEVPVGGVVVGSNV